jgi:hypothetical protein
MMVKTPSVFSIFPYLRLSLTENVMKKLYMLYFLVATAFLLQSGSSYAQSVLEQGIDSLFINNINAVFQARGNHFFTDEPAFEVPKFSGKTTIFLNTFWIGGITGDSTLYMAAERYGQGPYIGPAFTKFDFQVGPVMDSSAYSPYQDSVWNRIWNLKKSEIEYHKAHWNEAGYQPIPDILDWPGNGNVAAGQAQILAPFFDRNGDQEYNAMDGDYPLIKGDQSLFFIFNDDRTHAETEGNRLRTEIHGMAYAFDLPSNPAFYNTIFLNYKIYNRSERTYNNTYLGVFTDLEIGYYGDDYIGCDVQRGSYIGYNGTPIDGSGQPEAYGAHPPAQSVTILGGPLMDPDGIDNPRTDNEGKQLCNASVNGTGFGDTIIDNERLGMGKFLFFNNSNSGVPSYMTDPLFAQDYYKFLQGFWKDGTHMIYGGNGHASTGGYGPECDFMFPGVTDTLHWGCGCQPPNGAVNWTEMMVGNNPGDRRGVASMGPFTFLPGGVQEVDLAFTYARSESGTPWESVELLQTMIDSVRNAYRSNILPDGQTFNGIYDNREDLSSTMTLYPNPANTLITLDFHRVVSETVNISVMNSNGMTVRSWDVNPSGTKAMLDVSSLPKGLYIVTIRDKNFISTKKFMISR